MRKQSRRSLVALGVLLLGLVFLVPLSEARVSTATTAPEACGDAWQIVAPMPDDVYGPALASDGTSVWAAGGYSFTAPNYTNGFRRYDPVANTWTPLANLPDTVTMASAAYSPATNKVYVFGGYDGVNAHNNTRIYDIATNTWSAGANMPGARQQMASGYNPADGKIYLAAGFSTGNVDPSHSDVWQYDPVANTFTTRASMPAALGGAGSGIINGHLYVAGGRNLSGGVLASLYDYDIAGNSWSAKANIPEAENVPGSAAGNGKLYLFGFGNPFRPDFSPDIPQVPDTAATARAYDPATDTWGPAPALNGQRSFVGGAFASGRLVAAGGYTGAGTTDRTEVLQLDCGTTTLSALSPANVWVGLANSDDVGIRFDLQAIVSLNGNPIGSGSLASVPGGSSGFNRAILDSIPLTLTSPVAVTSGDSLSIEVFARNACSGSGKNSGRARLWYNGQPIDSGATRDAGSRFDATIDATNSDYFLRTGGALSTTAGAARTSVDVAAGPKCGPFVSFGTWTIPLP